MRMRIEEWLAESGRRGFNQGFAKGLAQVITQSFAEEGLAQVITQSIEQRIARGIKQGIEQGIEQGRSDQRKMLSRMAERKFGPESAERLSAWLAGVTAAHRLADAGDWIMVCETNAELLDCVRRAQG